MSSLRGAAITGLILSTLLIAERASEETQDAQSLILRTATHHAMQYYVSLPRRWTRDKSWPVLIAVEGSDKNFVELARAYVAARRDLPFIVIVPVVLTNGGLDLRSLPTYQYAAAVWDEVDRTGRCQFDLDGVKSVIDDAQTQYNGHGVFMTGFSAGGHLTWAMVLLHPERLAAAALAAANYVSRCIDEDKISTNAARASLPIKEFLGAEDPGRQGFEMQFDRARRFAQQHGYNKISLQVVSGKHEAFEAQVLTYFASLLN